MEYTTPLLIVLVLSSAISIPIPLWRLFAKDSDSEAGGIEEDGEDTEGDDDEPPRGGGVVIEW